MKILGTSPDSIDLAEDRQRFAQLLWDLGIRSRPSGTAISRGDAREVAARVGFPVVVRPSYVLGGRAMAIVYDVATLDHYMSNAVDVSHDRPILIDRFLEHAKEIDVDCVADATGAVIIGGIMEHIEEAGIHSATARAWSAAVPGRQAPCHHPRLHAADRPRAEGGGIDERAVHHQGRHGLRPGGEPAGVADRALPRQGDGPATRHRLPRA